MTTRPTPTSDTPSASQWAGRTRSCPSMTAKTAANAGAAARIRATFAAAV